MKAAIYNPYLDTLGGGERYTVGVVKAFLEKKYSVHLEWQEKDILEKLSSRFGISLDEVKILESVNRGDTYDACFWVSDGSIPTLRARNNILHFQIPFQHVNGKTLVNKMKLFRVKNIVVNSEFTKRFIDHEYGVKSKVIYPPVSVYQFKPKRKENIICYVGRFSSLVQQKRQDVLVDVFKKFVKKNKGWKLVLAGGVEVGNDNFTDKLRELSKGFAVELLESPKFSEIQELLGVSKMFWSASGYGVDENKHPEKVEHFGITVVEAMAAKAVPLILNKGGHKEIVEDTKTGFLWNKKKELFVKADLLSNDYSILSRMAKTASLSARNFSEEKFITKFSKLI